MKKRIFPIIKRGVGNLNVQVDEKRIKVLLKLAVNHLI